MVKSSYVFIFGLCLVLKLSGDIVFFRDFLGTFNQFITNINKVMVKKIWTYSYLFVTLFG